jgi:hypothetical protein
MKGYFEKKNKEKNPAANGRYHFHSVHTLRKGTQDGVASTDRGDSSGKSHSGSSFV